MSAGRAWRARRTVLLAGALAVPILSALVLLVHLLPGAPAPAGAASSAVGNWASLYGDRVIGLEEDVASYSELPKSSTAAEDAAWCMRIASDALDDVHTPPVPDAKDQALWRNGVQNLYVGAQACEALAAGHTLYATTVTSDLSKGTKALQTLSTVLALRIGSRNGTSLTTPNIVIEQRGLTTFGNGTWTVGTAASDISSGTFVTPGGAGCAWSRRGASGVLATGRTTGEVVVTIVPTDKSFKTKNCGTWLPIAPSDSTHSSFGNGIHAVGIDIGTGTYTTRGGTNCKWEGLRDFTGVPASVVAEGSGSGSLQASVSVSELGFESQGCGTWKLVG